MDISYDALSAISRELQAAAAGLEGTAVGAPSSVDAGELTPVVAGLLAQLMEGAAAVGERLDAAGGAVTAHVADLRRTDDGVASWFAWQGPR